MSTRLIISAIFVDIRYQFCVPMARMGYIYGTLCCDIKENTNNRVCSVVTRAPVLENDTGRARIDTAMIQPALPAVGQRVHILIKLKVFFGTVPKALVKSE